MEDESCLKKVPIPRLTPTAYTSESDETPTIHSYAPRKSFLRLWCVQVTAVQVSYFAFDQSDSIKQHIGSWVQYLNDKEE